MNAEPIKANEYLNGFNFMSKEQLSDFCAFYGLSFSVEQLLYIQSYFKNEKKMFPTLEQIKFFDELNRIRISKKDDFSVFCATAENNTDCIVDASKDLLSKYSVSKNKIYGAMPMSTIASVASDYLTNIGYAENDGAFIPSYGKSNLSYYIIHSGDEVPVFSLNLENSQKNSRDIKQITSMGNIFIMLCPTADMPYAEYANRALAFFSKPELSSAITNQKSVPAGYGLFDILLKEESGIFVNLSEIPEIEKDSFGKVLHLSALTTACIGRYVFTANSTAINFIKQSAAELSLVACVFAFKNESSLFSLENTRNPAFSFDFQFLNNILNFKTHKEYRFSSELDQPLGERKNVYLTDTRISSRQTYHAEKILDFGKIIACATSRKLTSAPHRTAAIAVLDAVTALVSKGVSKNSISLHIAYTLSGGTEDPVELGKNLAAVLGAYRSMIELGVSDDAPIINYNSEKREIIVLATAKPPIRRIRASLKTTGASLYFIPFEYLPNGMPNYESYRRSLEFFYSLLENDKIHSAFAINENLFTIIENALVNEEFEINETVNKDELLTAHGILIETDDANISFPTALFMGKTSK